MTGTIGGYILGALIFDGTAGGGPPPPPPPRSQPDPGWSSGSRGGPDPGWSTGYRAGPDPGRSGAQIT
jgi:hypothetical protein